MDFWGYFQLFYIVLHYLSQFYAILYNFTLNFDSMINYLTWKDLMEGVALGSQQRPIAFCFTLRL